MTLKMNNIFITYGDDNFYKSRIRICKEAKSIKLFDRVIEYTPRKLPNFIKSSPLFGFPRGGGYWVWKPYIIYKTLLDAKEGDIVWYVDAGCTLNPDSEEWNYLQEKMKSHNAIMFQYRNNVKYEGWEQFCRKPQNNNPQMIHWTKPSVSNYFKIYYKSD